MVKRCLLVGVTITFISCTKHKPLVDVVFADSLINNYQPSQQLQTAQQDLTFWHNRFDSTNPDLVNRQKYAQALLTRFHLTGDIKDLVNGDRLIHSLNDFYRGKEPGILITLGANKMLRHQFMQAGRYLDSAMLIIPDNAGAKMTWSDAQLESGNSSLAAMILSSVASPQDYGYNFRLSKLDHYNGSFDSAISHMMKAVALATSPYMKQVALSNAADLYLHEGKVDKAYELYKNCLQLNGSDFHSLSAIGWLAIMHDENAVIAERIFSFINTHHSSPDALWRLIQSHEVSDPVAAKKYAGEFIARVSSQDYGNMYAKYLISLYTGLMNNPEKAVQLALYELNNRATPQTYAWLCWSLACKGEMEKAYAVYLEKISGKPLEPLELFYMGKMMRLMKKNQTAKIFFRAALKNKYDLSPLQLKEMENF
jgi:tetratricopeptide (TPR) repeat protein